jgi:2-isopropylmalate synthase
VRDPFELVSYRHEADESGDRLNATMRIGEETVEFAGEGNGPIAALVHGLGRRQDVAIGLLGYHEHAMSTGEDAVAAAYVEVDVDGIAAWGVALHPSIVTASLHAVVNAINRAALARRVQESAVHAFDAV